jgi:leucyl/phenylalanyl-tRNA--protein transferase
VAGRLCWRWRGGLSEVPVDRQAAMPELIWLDDDDPFPPTRLAWGTPSDAPGLLAAGGDLTLQRLEQAYRHGIYPWFSPGQPVLWWSPDPRMVLKVADFRVSKTFAKTLRRFVRAAGNEVRIDHAFGRVIEACAGTPRAGQDGTWIVPQMVQAYSRWHAKGRVHSVETWIDGELTGGLYGVAIGRMFFGESMFSWRSEASKISLAALVCFCRAHGITLIDCQQNTGHLRHGCAREPRAERTSPCPGARVADWTYDSRMWEQLALFRRDAPQGTTAFVVAVLCDGALSVQLPAGQAGALAGGDAQSPDQCRRLFGPGGQRLSPQWHVHLPALLRRLSRLRAAARAGQ